MSVLKRPLIATGFFDLNASTPDQRRARADSRQTAPRCQDKNSTPGRPLGKRSSFNDPEQRERWQASLQDFWKRGGIGSSRWEVMSSKVAASPCQPSAQPSIL